MACALFLPFFKILAFKHQRTESNLYVNNGHLIPFITSQATAKRYITKRSAMGGLLLQISIKQLA